MVQKFKLKSKRFLNISKYKQIKERIGMKRLFSQGQKSKNKNTEKTLSKKKLVIKYRFRTSCMNPFNNAKVAIKVTFNDDIKEPEVKITSNSSVIIYGVKSHEILTKDSSEYYLRSFTVTKDLKYKGKLIIALIDDSEDLYIQLPEKIE